MVRAKRKRNKAVFGTMVTEFDNPAISIILADAGLDFSLFNLVKAFQG